MDAISRIVHAAHEAEKKEIIGTIGYGARLTPGGIEEMDEMDPILSSAHAADKKEIIDTMDYVCTPIDGVIFVIVGERTKFDAIELEERVGANGCHSKALGDMSRGTTTVIFQWWGAPTPAPSRRIVTSGAEPPQVLQQ